MIKSADVVHALGFTDNEISECLNRKDLLSIELEFTRKCNLRCIYCYSHGGIPREDELSTQELKSVISQAQDLGAKKIILLGGGEPLLYKGFEDIVLYTHSLGLQQVLFTNGTVINKKTARFLLRRGVSVIIKQNSFRKDVQDRLAAVRGAFDNIQHGIKILMDAGYSNGGPFLGIQTVICRQNFEELPSMWKWARENSIVPYFEILTLQGRAKENRGLNVSLSEMKTLFEYLEHIDKERYGLIWRSHPVIAAFSCKRHLYSCLINSQGHVQPCTGIDISVGNIRNEPLRKILDNSEVIKKLRNVYKNLEGRCNDCKYSDECYGCRGNAYQMTGNYLASDPTCWRHKKHPGSSAKGGIGLKY